MTLKAVTINDKYTLREGRAFMTGIQALVRLPMMQRRRDQVTGLNTAGYISGYRGSPLGGLDQQMLQAQAHLQEHQIVFQPGVNEDLAATAIWGTQQTSLSGENRYDGVFAMWYGKGPGVDRSGDALRHGNLAGSAQHGGVLVLLGDDHTGESSTTVHQSEYAMMDAMIPVLNPAGVQEFLDYGLYGWAMSRYSGCWVALKCIHDTVESAASVDVSDGRIQIHLPDDHPLPPDGLNIRWPDTWHAQERRLHDHKLAAVQAFCRANQLDQVKLDNPDARLGIVTTGKSYLDVLQALDDLGINEQVARHLGLRLYKVALSFPLEPQGALAFCQGLDIVIVVEEKRGLIETQLKDLLYGQPGAPTTIVGKRNEQGEVLLQSPDRLDSNQVALAIGSRLLRLKYDQTLAVKVNQLRGLNEAKTTPPAMLRTPYFCPGCPHNTSTRVPEGSHALAGIGCHFMAQWMDRDTARYTQMGGEGASWIGEAPFSKREHMFQNIGDGTYFHSGLLALRATVSAKVNVTYKILFNDAVAMTGGQSVDGPLTVPRITQQVYAEGVRRIAVVSDEADKYPADAEFAPGVSIHHRRDLDTVQRELREVPGTSVLVYDQTCAAEKRRRRKRGKFPDPDQRVFINDAVCEGCGDCGVKSNCVAVLPLETEFGRKRMIDQSACNKDFSCLEGFCPSFVTVRGGRLRKAKAITSDDFGSLPEPAKPELERPYNIVIAGVGGTGIVTIGALLGMAAHIEDKGCSVLDMMGLAQKGGAVTTHLRLGATPQAVTTSRIAASKADLILGCDLVVAASPEALKTVRHGQTYIVANGQEIMTGDFTRNPDFKYPKQALLEALQQSAGQDQVDALEATRLANALLGDAIATNLFMLGYAYQKGRVPLSAEALEQAIELNGVAVEFNKKAFLWGRRTAHDKERVTRVAFPSTPVALAEHRPVSLDAVIAQREAFLSQYQNKAYAKRYRQWVERVRSAETAMAPGSTDLAAAVARYYFKLLAYKDEYEVARLYTDGDFQRKLQTQFEGDYTLEFHLAPPLWAQRDPHTGAPRKKAYGPWMLKAFAMLAKLRWLRGTPLDVFGYTRERRQERQLIKDYETLLGELLERLSPDKHALAVQLASLPEHIRGYGHVKQRHIEQTRQRETQLLEQFRRPAEQSLAA